MNDGAPPVNRWLANWLSPSGASLILGMAMMGIAAWVSLNGRLSSVESKLQTVAEQRLEDRETMKDMNAKLDRLIERRP